MINYHKNKLINECLCKYYETFAHTLDTADFVPEQYNAQIIAYIFKNMRKSFRKIDRENRRYLRKCNHKKTKSKKGGK